MILSSYSPRKAAQVIAYLAMKTNDRCLAVLKAVKLVYLADRESLSRFGFPILEEPHVAMPHGPVNSTTYSYINGEENLENSDWLSFLTARENNQVAAVISISTNDLDELSEADIACLDAVWDRFGSMSKWEIRDWTHDPKNIPEWTDPEGSSCLMPLKGTLTHLKIENADAQAKLIDEYRQIDRVFSNLRR